MSVSRSILISPTREAAGEFGKHFKELGCVVEAGPGEGGEYEVKVTNPQNGKSTLTNVSCFKDRDSSGVGPDFSGVHVGEEDYPSLDVTVFKLFEKDLGFD